MQVFRFVMSIFVQALLVNKNPGFLAFATERVGTCLRVYPPSKHSLCPTPYHVKKQELGLQEQALSITSRTTGNLRPSGYGAFAHQHDQNLLTRTLSFTTLMMERVGMH